LSSAAACRSRCCGSPAPEGDLVYQSRHRAPRRGHRARLWLYASLVLVLGGAFLIVRAATDSVAMPPAAAQLVPKTVGTGPPPDTAVHAGKPLKRSVPVKILIPLISVDAPVEQLGQAADGSIDLPPLGNHNLAGWYDKSVTPGQKGTSVILGHVDNVNGTSVFFYVKELKKGDAVDVVLADGKTANFTVDSVREVVKADFSASSVYGSEPYPALRLVTCGGPFDSATGQYLDNIVVYAHLHP
jgi:LPXTG-site transpeptidase (sortase) family protein